MLALRRAVNPTRVRNYCKFVIQCVNLEERKYHRARGYFLPRTCSQEPSFCTLLSFLQSKEFSSENGGGKSSDQEDELEDGFSDLDVPPEADELEVSKEVVDDDELVSSVEFSEDELEEASDNSPRLFDAKPITTSKKRSVKKKSEPITNGEKGSGKKKSDSQLLEFVKGLRAKKHDVFLEGQYASKLDSIAKAHGLQKAEKYLDEIPLSLRGELIYRTLLINCVAATKVKKAEQVFNKIRDLGLPITIFACNQLILLYKRVNQKKIADVLLLMEEKSIKPSLATYRLLIDSKGRVADISGMEGVMEAMKVEGVEPDLTIQATIAKHYIHNGSIEKANSLLKEMEGVDIQQNRAACTALLSLYADLGRAEEAERVWNVCRTDPSLNECLAVIEAWDKLGRVEEAEQIFNKMMSSRKNHSARYYNALLKVYVNHRLVTKGKDLVKRMSESGFKINPVIADALVKLYVESGEVEKAELVLQESVEQNQIGVLYSSYITILDNYAEMGDVHNAEKIFHRLMQKGYVGRARQYWSLIRAYRTAKTPAYGFRERMKADNIVPNKALEEHLAAVDAFQKDQISESLH